MTTFNESSYLRPISWRAAFAAWIGGSVLVWFALIAPFLAGEPGSSHANMAGPAVIECADDDVACLSDLAPAAGPQE